MTHQPSQDQDLRTALEPFADLISTIEKEAADSRIFTIAGFGPSRKVITVGHIRRAHTALTPAQAPDKAGEREGVADVGVSGPINGMGEPDKSGSYVRLSVSAHGFTRWHKVSLGAAEVLAAELAGLLDGLAPQPNGTEASRGVIPAGWKLVPVEPTEEMLLTAREQVGLQVGLGNRVLASYWRALLAATPTPPLSPDSTGPAGDGWSDLAPAEIVRRTRCEADTYDGKDDGFTTRAAIWRQCCDAILGKFAALTPSAPIAAPVRDALAADVLHYIQSSENGISRVPRQLLCRLEDVLRAGAPEAPVRDDGARERVRNTLVSFVQHTDVTTGFSGRGIDAIDWSRRDELVEAILASLPAPAGDVPGEAQTQSSTSPVGAVGSGSRKWGPSFPPATCNAWEDCHHDGVCHDFDQCQIKGPAETQAEDEVNEDTPRCYMCGDVIGKEPFHTHPLEGDIHERCCSGEAQTQEGGR